MKVVIVSMTPGIEYSLAPAMLKAYCDQYGDLRRAAEIVIRSFAGRVKKEQISGNAFIRDAYDIENVIGEILNEQPDILAFSCYIWNISYVLKACRLAKSRRSGVKIILGGPQVTPYPESILRSCPCIDIIIRGEGEITFCELLTFFALGTGKLDKIDGITYRDGEKIRSNRDRALIANLDEIPSPYLSGTVDLNKIGSILGCYETYRGCVMGCRFCNWGKNKRIRYFSLERVRKEISLIGSSSVKRVWYTDSIANLNRERFKEILRMIADNNPKDVIYDMEMTAELLDEETIDLIGKARIGYIAFGLQSTCRDALAACGRRWDRDKFETNIKSLSRKTNVDIYIDLIYGLPGDNWETYRRSLEYCADLFPERISAHSLIVLPGSEFYEKPEEYGIQFRPSPPYWAKHSNTFSEKDMKEAKKWLTYLELYYFKPVRTLLHVISKKTGKNPIEILRQYVNCLKGRVSLNKIISPVVRADAKNSLTIAKALAQAARLYIEESRDPELTAIKEYLADLVRFECCKTAFRTDGPDTGYPDPVRGQISLLDKPVLIPGVIAGAFSYDAASGEEYQKVLDLPDYCPSGSETYIVFDNTKINRINAASYDLLICCNGKITIRDIIHKFSVKIKKPPDEIQEEIVKGIMFFSEAGIIRFLHEDQTKEKTAIHS